MTLKGSPEACAKATEEQQNALEKPRKEYQKTPKNAEEAQDLPNACLERQKIKKTLGNTHSPKLTTEVPD